ncbi:hypothetical protein FDENT_10822 [Fusarium denticulatum]|uniref:Uncharacterized protein n=1 Tax=Fusarium denticulatum TaxID=48507 RepID=A0A8H5TKS2_9HYPO|nr:hypothetical protein FDENT_10822 [Fusarium denticulatum]
MKMQSITRPGKPGELCQSWLTLYTLQGEPGIYSGLCGYCVSVIRPVAGESIIAMSSQLLLDLTGIGISDKGLEVIAHHDFQTAVRRYARAFKQELISSLHYKLLSYKIYNAEPVIIARDCGNGARRPSSHVNLNMIGDSSDALSDWTVSLELLIFGIQVLKKVFSIKSTY